MKHSTGPSSRQLELALAHAAEPAGNGSWGGKRRGAGRKPVGARAGVPHRARPDHHSRHPVHVTLRAGITGLRRQKAFSEVRRALTAASRGAFRVVHFSVQTNHVHMIVEATDKRTLCSGVRGVAIRIARGLNRAMARSGRVWKDRYHARPLETPREVRNALVYVLLNRRKHRPGAPPLDGCSSSAWFDGWKSPQRPPHLLLPKERDPLGVCPVVAARTWLATVGWRRHGLVRCDEAPKPER
jgi:REP element-mobilizing transposase RayT